MLTFFANRYFPKAFHTPDHSICIVEYNREKLSLNPISSPGLEPRTAIGFVTLVPVISSPKRTNFALAPFFCRAYFTSYRNHPGQDSNPGQFFLWCGPCFRNLLFETTFVWVLLSCFVSEQQKPLSPGIEPRTVLRYSGLCFCNLFFETNNFGHGAVLLPCLVSKLQESLSAGIELRTLPEF
jgi:hypothetical protein